MGFFSYEYINKEHLNGLDKYKYSAVDNSPLSRYVMSPFWDWCVKFYPLWLAPNLLTFVGFLWLIVNFVLFAIYDYSFYGYCFNRDDCLDVNSLNLTLRQLAFEQNIKSSPDVPAEVCSCIPQWLWFFIFIGQFLAYNLDGTDGKQARKTKSSTPLGELFDHGLDSWATLFLPLALFSVFGRSGEFGMNVDRMYAILWLILASFIISHWEKYNTGVLFLPWSYDLSQVGMTVLFLSTFLLGQKFWLFRISFLGNETFTFLLEISLYAFSIGLSVPFSIYNMYKAYNEGRLKQKSFYEGIRPLFSTIYLFAIQLIWIKYSHNEILHTEPRMVFWLTGTLFSNIACRLIVAQMTNTRCQIFNWTLIPLTITVFLFTYPLEQTSLGPYLTKTNEAYALYFMVVLVTLAHIHYGICMVRQISKHLNIYTFSITSKPPKTATATSKVN